MLYLRLTIYLAIVTMIFSACSEEDNIIDSNTQENQNILVSVKQQADLFTINSWNTNQGVEERLSKFDPASEFPNTSCNCQYRIEQVEIEYPSTPAGLNSDNLQFALTGGDGQVNETCDVILVSPPFTLVCRYFTAVYDPYLDEDCTISNIENNPCFDILDDSFVGGGGFRCDVPFYSSFPVEFAGRWILPEDCTNGELESGKITISIICGYNGKVDNTGNEDCDRVYENQTAISSEAIANITLDFDPSTGGVSESSIISLGGCGCDPTLDE